MFSYRTKWLHRNDNIIKSLYPNFKSIKVKISETEGRCFVYIKYGKKYAAKQFAKLKMEVRYEKRLGRDDTVDHIDGDKLNDFDYNLRLLERRKHCSLDAKRRMNNKAICIWCEKEFELRKGQVESRNKIKSGPFCSKSCTGKYGASVQNGGNKLKRIKYKVNYGKLKDLE